MNTEQMNRLGTGQNGSGHQVATIVKNIIYTGSNAQNIFILAEMLMSPMREERTNKGPGESV